MLKARNKGGVNIGSRRETEEGTPGGTRDMLSPIGSGGVREPEKEIDGKSQDDTGEVMECGVKTTGGMCGILRNSKGVLEDKDDGPDMKQC